MNIKTKLTIYLFFILLGSGFLASGASAATRYSVATGNWSSTATWSSSSGGSSGSSVPVAGDTVYIEHNYTVTVDSSTAACGSVTLGYGVTSTFYTGTLTFASSGSPKLAVSGAVQVGGTTGNSSGSADTGTITFTSGSELDAGSMVIGGSRGTGTVTMTAGGTLSMAGAITTVTSEGATFTAGTGTVIFKATNSLPGNTVTAFNNLTINGGTTTMGSVNITVGGTLTVTSGAFATNSTYTLGVTGATNITGTLTLASTGAKTFTGDVTLNAGAVWNETGAAAVNFGGSLSNAATTFTASTGTHTFSGTAKTISGGTATVIPKLTVSGTLENDSTLTVSTTLAGSGTLTNGANAILNIGVSGSIGLSNLTANATGNTVNYNLAGAQTVRLTTDSTYYNLTLSGTGTNTKTLTAFNVTHNLYLTGTASATTVANMTIGGTLTLDSGTTFTTGANYTLGVTGTTSVTGTLANSSTGTKTYTGSVTINSGGSWTTGTCTINLGNNFTNSSAGTVTFTNSTVVLNGSSAQTMAGTLTGAAAFYNLTITNSSGADATDNELTSFSPGVIFGAAATVTNNYAITTASVRVQYLSGATYTFNNINWNGQAAGTRIFFRNSATSGTWLMNVSGTETAVSYVNVSRSDASGGNQINGVGGNNYDGQNNVNWTFVIVAKNVYYSVGQSASNLMTGTPTMNMTSGAAVLSAAQTGNIGVGDRVTYNTIPSPVSFMNTNTMVNVGSNSYSGNFTVNSGGTNVMAFAIIAYDNTIGESINSVTLGGQTMHSCGSPAQNTNGYENVQVYYLANPPTGTPTLAVSANAAELYINVVVFQNVNQTAPVRPGTYQTTTSASPVSNFSISVASNPSDLTLTAVNGGGSSGGFATNQTIDGSNVGGAYSGASDHATTGASSVTHTWTFADSSSYACLGFSIQAASANIVAYISAKTNVDQMHWSLVTALGATPTNVSGATVNSITHEYTSLEAAVAGASDANHINNTNLTAANVILNIPCYYDSGPDTTPVTVTGYTASATNYINIYAPNNTATQANNSQRAAGKWNGFQYNLSVTGYGTVLEADVPYTRVTGLQATTNDYNAICFGSSQSTAVFDSDIATVGNNTLGYAFDGAGIFVNDLAYNSGYGFSIIGSDYNSTAVGNGTGFYAGGYDTATFKNCLGSGNTTDFAHSAQSYGWTYTNCASSDATATGGTGSSGNRISQTFSFVNAAGNDYHLASTDTGARGYGTNLSADSTYAFSTDIDGQNRPETGAWDIGADQSATAIYYSVGQNISNHSSGGNVSIASGEATFTVAQTATDLGVGDVLTAGGNTYYLAQKIDTSHWNVITKLGAVPADLSSTTVTSIAHAFSSLEGAVDAGNSNGAFDSSHLNTTDLVAGNYILNIPCYYDTGPDTTWVQIRNWNTGANNYIRIYTPYDTATEVNQSQRHNGKWSNNAYSLQLDTSGLGGWFALNVEVNNAWVDGLEIYPTNSASSGWPHGLMIQPLGSANVSISNNIIKAIGNFTTGNGVGIAIDSAGASSIAKIWNNIIYNFSYYSGDGNESGITLGGANITPYIYNNTIYNSNKGIWNYMDTTVVAKNNISVDNNASDYVGQFDASSVNNISSDSSSPNSGATDCGAHSCQNQTVQFVNAAANDFHLSPNDTAAKNAGVNLSADPYLPFDTDIDGDARPSVNWDIGADEVTFIPTDTSTNPAGSTVSFGRNVTMKNNVAINTTNYAITPGPTTGVIINNGSATSTSLSINTTGCSLLVMVVSHLEYDPSLDTISDSKGNTWHKLATYGEHTNEGYGAIYYAYDHGGSALSVGTGHTFTDYDPGYDSGGNPDYTTFVAACFKGTDTTSAVFESGTDKGNFAYSGNTVQPGSVSAAAAGDLILTAAWDGWSSGTAYTINDSFSTLQNEINGSDESLNAAYLLAPNTSAVNPTWTGQSGQPYIAGAIAVFKAAPH